MIDINQSMSKAAFKSDADEIEKDFENITRENGVGIVSIQMMCVAIFRLLWLYVCYRVARDRD
jgi:hypothetical protein